MRLLKPLGRFLFYSALVAQAGAVGAAALGVLAMAFGFALDSRPRKGEELVTWVLLGLILYGFLLGAVALFMVYRGRAARERRPVSPALPDPGPRWADRPGARPPDAIQPDQAGLSEHPGPGVERSEAP
jgi:hypothetical protein